jgi:hypothetical protein
MIFVVYKDYNNEWRWYNKTVATNHYPILLHSFGPFKMEALARKDCQFSYKSTCTSQASTGELMFTLVREVYPNGGRGDSKEDGVPYHVPRWNTGILRRITQLLKTRYVIVKTSMPTV